MSAPEPVGCSGAPRDLGYDQGRAYARRIRRELRRAHPALARWRRSPFAERVERDLQRYFPHMAERLAGLARGARVSRRRLAGRLLPELALNEADRVQRAGAGTGVGITAERSGSGPLLARCLDRPRHAGSGFELRRSEPDADFASVEIGLPWLVPPVAGVNEHGLAVAFTSVPAAPLGADGCWAPAALLVQDCLQRFDRTDKAVEWCQSRPAGGEATILLADAGGDVASVIVQGRQRQVQRPSSGVMTGLSRTLRRTALEKSCLDRQRCDREALFEIFASHDGTARGDNDSACRHGHDVHTTGLVILDPVERSLTFLDAAPCRPGPRDLRSFRP